ncbi:MAG TPA: YncE family protein [Vicinamibacterales bacterium]|jgi:DNA-binding beta-propeller fold protein YncE
MKLNRIPAILVGAAIVMAALSSQVPLQAADGPYKLLKEIAVATDGGWDYLSVDSAAKRLYVAHGTKVVVIDTAKNEVVGEVAPTPGVHGFAVAPDLGKGFSSHGQESKAGLVDLKTLQILSKVDTGQNPDAILYEPAHKEVYTFNGRGKSATVFDATSGAVKATIPLAGKPEFAVVDIKAGRIYNNIEDTNSVVAIDTTTHAVVNTWPIAPGEEASGLAIDLANHRLFIGCSNNMMVMMDSTNGKVLGSLPIGPGVDANAFDPGTGYAFASSSDGTLTVAKVDATGKLALVQKLATPPRSRTMTLDPATHRLYVAAAEYKPGAPGADGKPGRPTMVPGSFKVLVYEMMPAR